MTIRLNRQMLMVLVAAIVAVIALTSLSINVSLEGEDVQADADEFQMVVDEESTVTVLNDGKGFGEDGKAKYLSVVIDDFDDNGSYCLAVINVWGGGKTPALQCFNADGGVLPR